MRVYGLNLAAILFAAIIIYLVGFLLTRIIVDSDVWMAQNGISIEEMDAVGVSRIIYSPLLPVATAIGLALLCRWTGAKGPDEGMRLGLLVAMTSGVPALWYAWVYGVQDVSVPVLRSVMVVVSHAAAGALLGAWR